MENKLKKLAKKLEVKFDDIHLIKNAFVHRSYLNESNEFSENNERLEYLGDAVLEMATSEYLYAKFPKLQEGMLTNLRASLVRTESLAESSHELGFADLILMSRGEESTGGRDNQSLLANTFEAFLGALYLDQGFEVCKTYLHKYLFPKTDKIMAEGTYKDFKSIMQEVSQSKFKETPKYQLVEEQGPDHDKVFQMVAVIGKKKYGVGKGKSKQAAQEDAAKKTLEIIGNT